MLGQLKLLLGYLSYSIMFLTPPALFAGVVSLLFWAHSKFRAEGCSQVSATASGFFAAYLTSLGGTYSVWGSIAVLSFSAFLVERRIATEGISFSDLIQNSKLPVVAFCLVYVVCTNYFLRAFSYDPPPP